jgi:nucleoid-associated protein YgaU
MALAKLKIKTKQGEQAKGGVTEIEAHFNPNKIVLSKSVALLSQPASGRDVPEQQFRHGEPRSFNIDLLFDTYDTDSLSKKKVTDYTERLDKLTIVSEALHRPPICELSWGALGVFFEGVVEKLDHEYTLFMEDGTPVRATSKCVFKEYHANPDDQQKQARQSSDVVKRRIVKHGDTLSSIAAEVYHDPTLWRPIAEQNDLDDPSRLTPGMLLLVPTVTVSRSGRSRT